MAENGPISLKPARKKILDKHTTLTPEILVPRIGEYLVEQGLITSNDLERALKNQAGLKTNQSDVPLLGELLIQMGILSRKQLDHAITEYVIHLRSALEDSNLRLEHRVQQRTAELEAALRKLSELNQLKNNFIANISHELRTPLTHVKGYEELFLAGDLGKTTPQQSNALQTMIKATNRLERLIEDLILFASAERSQLNLDIQTFDLGKTCQEIIAQIELSAQERSLDLIANIPDALPPVSADQDKIRWVIHQFFDNAIKFTPMGGKITLDITQSDFRLYLTVSDTGIGIPPNRLKEVFEPFHQLDGSSTRRFGGTGLGLSLAQRIVTAHGSKIDIVSKLGSGTSFTFWLNKDDPSDIRGNI